MTPTAAIGDTILVSAVVIIAALEWRKHRRPRGQALAETALVLPVLLFIGLGFLEAGLLVTAKADQDRRTAVVAAWAAAHPDEAPGPLYATVVDAEGFHDCVTDLGVDEELGIVGVTATCQYVPVLTHGLWDGLPMTSEARAVLPVASPEPSP